MGNCCMRPSWDEWVGTVRLLKDTEENQRRKQQLKQEAQAGGRKDKAPARGKVTSPDVHGSGGKGRKRKAPDLVPLPCRPSVAELLADFISSKRSKRRGKGMAEVVNGIRCYFDRSLPLMLLYKEERDQFQCVFSRLTAAAAAASASGAAAAGGGGAGGGGGSGGGDGTAGGGEGARGGGGGGGVSDAVAAPSTVRPSDIYGAEHLLRLFTKLPAMLATVYFEQEALHQLFQNFNIILKYLQRNRATIFASSYVDAATALQPPSETPQ
ncbi:unnamed protein product [Closterium sp. Yama58-4]|nr:unnamed protein product [Closterium sp. Yama58-4]